MTEPFRIDIDAENGVVRLAGTLDLFHVTVARRGLKQALEAAGGRRAVIDLAGLTQLDSAGAILLHKCAVELKNTTAEQQSLFDLIAETPAAAPAAPPDIGGALRLLRDIGRATAAFGAGAAEITAFFGKTCLALAAAMRRPGTVRFGSIVHHIEAVGIDAIPIVGLIAFLISIVLAYQGAAQLRPMGAEQFTINLVALSVLREMGVLLTAIMLAGRSGSAFAAEIGVMKVRQEIDALEAIGVDPFGMLVMPRLLALIVVLPALTFVADMMGLLGGALLSGYLIDTSFSEYMSRVHQVAHGRDYAVGLIKAPIFALVIGIVGCMHGMKVSGSAESVGRETTASVVKSIFLILVLDAVFSVFFEEIGL